MLTVYRPTRAKLYRDGYQTESGLLRPTWQESLQQGLRALLLCLIGTGTCFAQYPGGHSASYSQQQMAPAGYAPEAQSQPEGRYQGHSPSHPQSPAGYGYPVVNTQYQVPASRNGEIQIPRGNIQPVQYQPVPAVNALPLPQRAVPVRTVQDSNQSDTARQLHRLIESMPSSEEDLEVIHRRSQLIVTRANVIRAAIADPNVIDVVQYGPREISIIGVSRGTTTLTLWFEGATEPLIYLVKVIRDPALDFQRRLDYGKLEKKLQTLFPNSKVYLIPMSYKIVVRGQARDAEEAAHILSIVRGEVINQEGSLGGPQPFLGGLGGDLGGGSSAIDNGAIGGIGNSFGGSNDLAAGFIINELRVPGEFQVSLTVRIAELNRSEMFKAGADISVLFNGSQLIESSLTGGAATLGGIFDNGDVSILLDWLKTNGIGKILVEPRLTVLSGRQARFLAGGEFAVPTIIGIAGAQGQSTTFRGFGTSVLVTPTVLDRDLIRLSTIAEYSDLNQANSVQGIPGTNARRIDTTVEMREGQTLALAGLYSHLMKTNISKIPFLGDIPKIGPALFSRKEKTQDENELLILITPDIVRPMDPEEVPPVPGFEVTYPGDHEFFWYNRIEGTPDTGHYQVPPYGSGSNGTNVGYQHFNPGPASPSYGPQPVGPQPGGMNQGGPNQGVQPAPGGYSVPQHAYPPTPGPAQPRPSTPLMPTPISSNNYGSQGNRSGYTPGSRYPGNQPSSQIQQTGMQQAENAGQPGNTYGRGGYSAPSASSAGSGAGRR